MLPGTTNTITTSLMGSLTTYTSVVPPITVTLLSATTETSSETSTQFETLLGPTVTVTTSLSGALTTIISTLPPVNVTQVQVQATTATNDVFMTVTEVSTAYLTYTAFPTRTCDFCKVDIYGLGLEFPTVYEPETVYATTIGVYTRILPDGSSVTETSTTTAVSATECGLVTSRPTTWLFSGVELTSPTKYMYFTQFSHEYLFPSPNVAGGCGLSTLSLVFPTSDTAAFIRPTTALPTAPTVAPSLFVSYMDMFSTVTEQLNGTFARQCDDPSATVESPRPTTETATTAFSVDGLTTIFHPPEAGIFAPTSSTVVTTPGTTTSRPNTTPVDISNTPPATPQSSTNGLGGSTGPGASSGGNLPAPSTSAAGSTAGSAAESATGPQTSGNPAGSVSPSVGPVVSSPSSPFVTPTGATVMTVVDSTGGRSTVLVATTQPSGLAGGTSIVVAGSSGTSTVLGSIISTPAITSSQTGAVSGNVTGTDDSTLLTPVSVIAVSNGVTVTVPAINYFTSSGFGSDGTATTGAGFTAASTSTSAAIIRRAPSYLVAIICAFATTLFMI
ncbi:hypothetical protein FKW77_002372 [Venturia effusa]|uniref:Uncharacterized protein n=1 Tax=Venturia effusa TaxID=50376 RepID=A0A517LPU5_9PEZI|nr:hypothetical protein FKW77_002372 [Venturia effusa]